MPLKVADNVQFGGVDSRSNPVNMPTQRFLLCRNFVVKIDGHLELREGYTMVWEHTSPGSG